MYAENFIFDSAKMIKRTVICLNDKVALMGASNTVYVAMSKSTFIGFNKADDGSSELVETIQLDYNNKIFKYSKSLNATKVSDYYRVQGNAVFIGNLIKLTK